MLLAQKEEEVERVAVEEAEVEEGVRDPSSVGLAAGRAQGGQGSRGVLRGPTDGVSGTSPAAGDNFTSMENEMMDKTKTETSFRVMARWHLGEHILNLKTARLFGSDSS